MQATLDDKNQYMSAEGVISLALLRGLEAGFALGMRLAATPAQMVLREE